MKLLHIRPFPFLPPATISDLLWSRSCPMLAKPNEIAFSLTPEAH